MTSVIALSWNNLADKAWTALTIWGTFELKPSTAPWYMKVVNWQDRGYRVYFKGNPIGWVPNLNDAAKIATEKALSESTKRRRF